MPQFYTPPEVPPLKTGSRARFFDALVWSRTGDIGDNDRFFMPATIIRVYYDKDYDRLADVLFDHRDVVSTGHFVAFGNQRPLRPEDRQESEQQVQLKRSAKWSGREIVI